MLPSENPYQSPETIEPPAPQPTALGRGSRYLAAILAMPLGAGLGVAAVFLAAGVVEAILESQFGAAAMTMSYGLPWAVINFPLSLFLGAAAAFAIVLRMFSETLIAGWIASSIGGLALAALFCALLIQRQVELVDLVVYGPLAVFSIALIAAGICWLLRRAR